MNWLELTKRGKWRLEEEEDKEEEEEEEKEEEEEEEDWPKLPDI